MYYVQVIKSQFQCAQKNSSFLISFKYKLSSFKISLSLEMREKLQGNV